MSVQTDFLVNLSTKLRHGSELSEIHGANLDGGVGYDLPGTSFTAFSGTGFNEDNIQHQIGSDGLRYAIAVQQARDITDYQLADQLRAWVDGPKFEVQCGKNCTIVVVRP